MLLALAGPATAASFSWASGNFIPGTTAPNPLTAGDVLNISTTNAKSLSGVGTVITNNGSVNMLAGSTSLGLANNPGIVNNGTWTLQDDVGLNAGGSALPTFVNNGVLRKTAHCTA